MGNYIINESGLPENGFWYTTSTGDNTKWMPIGKTSTSIIDYNSISMSVKDMTVNHLSTDKDAEITITGTFTSNALAPKIVDVDVIVPNKVVKVDIEHGGRVYSYKQVCRGDDEFDLGFAISLGIIKHFNKLGYFKGYLTNAGREYYARFYMDTCKEHLDAVNKAIKFLKRKEKAKEKKKKLEEEIKAIKERRREKNKKKRERRCARLHGFD